MMETYLTVAEAAKILNIHPRTVTNYLTAGRLRGAKMGRIWRIDEKDVRTFFEDAKTQTAESIQKGALHDEQ